MDVPPVDLAMLLNQSSHALTSRLAGALREVGLSVRGYCVLVKAQGAEHTQNRLAELAYLDKTTMVVTVDELERLGLAERRPAPGDRRARVIALTAAGEAALTRAHHVVSGVYDEVLAGVPARDRVAFLRVLDGLVAGPLATPFHLEKPVRRRRAA